MSFLLPLPTDFQCLSFPITICLTPSSQGGRALFYIQHIPGQGSDLQPAECGVQGLVGLADPPCMNIMLDGGRINTQKEREREERDVIDVIDFIT